MAEDNSNKVKELEIKISDLEQKFNSLDKRVIELEKLKKSVDDFIRLQGPPPVH